jgi:hypothetical protein
MNVALLRLISESPSKEAARPRKVTATGATMFRRFGQSGLGGAPATAGEAARAARSARPVEQEGGKARRHQAIRLTGIDRSRLFSQSEIFSFSVRAANFLGGDSHLSFPGNA